jgi:outer membrane protein
MSSSSPCAARHVERMRCNRTVALLAAGLLLAAPAAAQTIEAISFDEAIRRAITNNPSIRQAAAGILRAESLLQQTRASSLPSVNANLATNVIGPVPEFAGESIVPRSQLNSSLSLGVPLLAPVRWAERTQAADQVLVSERSADDIRREVAVATAQAYLAIIAQKRVLELNERARDNSRAHFEYADQRFKGGLGSRLNALRAQQELSSGEARVEEARLGVRRSQEALGVLVAAEGPIDAAAEPNFELPAEGPAAAARASEANDSRRSSDGEHTLQASVSLPPVDPSIAARTDIRLLTARMLAAERVVRDSWREYLPSVTTLFAPQVLTPSGLFSPSRSWSVSFVATVPIWEAGERRGRARERQAVLDLVRAERASVARQATSEVRTAREAVQSTERALASARLAADQAAEVLRITDVAFRAGATTNIEVVDAQRRARDAETAAVIAEDSVRRARLDLLVATGGFPR